MAKSLQQGQADGMCGLYALLNLLSSLGEDWDEVPTDTLWYLLDACRHHGWLNPYTLTLGFEEHQLKAILDLQICNYRMPYKTYFADDLRRSIQCKTFYQMAKIVTDAGGSLIASSSRRSHWLLVTSEDKKIVVVDSANPSQPSTELKAGQRALSMEFGVVLLPEPRARVDVGL